VPEVSRRTVSRNLRMGNDSNNRPLRHAEDIVVAPINALLLAEHLPNAQLIVYSDSSHGTQYQHARMFLEHVKLFLSAPDSPNLPRPIL